MPGYSVAAVTERGNLMRRGCTASANVIWKMSSLFNSGIEYRYVQCTDQNRKTLHNNRLYAMMLMNF